MRRRRRLSPPLPLSPSPPLYLAALTGAVGEQVALAVHGLADARGSARGRLIVVGGLGAGGRQRSRWPASLKSFGASVSEWWVIWRVVLPLRQPLSADWQAVV